MESWQLKTQQTERQENEGRKVNEIEWSERKAKRNLLRAVFFLHRECIANVLQEKQTKYESTLQESIRSSAFMKVFLWFFCSSSHFISFHSSLLCFCLAANCQTKANDDAFVIIMFGDREYKERETDLFHAIVLQVKIATKWTSSKRNAENGRKVEVWKNKSFSFLSDAKRCFSYVNLKMLLIVHLSLLKGNRKFHSTHFAQWKCWQQSHFRFERKPNKITKRVFTFDESIRQSDF